MENYCLYILFQQDKHVTFVVGEVLLKQEVIDNGKDMPSEKKMEHKEVSEKSGGCQEQARVTNSNFTSKTEGTQNENENLDKGNQDLDQDKGTNTVNGSSDHQNINEKSVNLPIQGERSQGLELQDSKIKI